MKEEGFVEMALNMMRGLAYRNQACKDIFFEKKGAHALLDILKLEVPEKVLWICSAALKVMSMSTSTHKLMILNLGCIPILCNILHKGSSERVVKNSCLTIRNISDLACKVNLDLNAIEELTSQVKKRDKLISKCLVETMANITCCNPNNKREVCNFGGINALLQYLSEDEMMTPALKALRHLCHGHTEEEVAKEEVMRVGLQYLEKILKEDESRMSLIKETIKFIKVLCSSNRENVIRKLLPLVQKFHSDLEQLLTNSDHLKRDMNIQIGEAEEAVAAGASNLLHSGFLVEDSVQDYAGEMIEVDADFDNLIGENVLDVNLRMDEHSH